MVHPIIGINVQLDQLDIHTDTNVYCMLHSTFYFTLHIAHYIYIAPYILHRTSHFRLHLSGSNIQLDQPIRHTCYNFSSAILQFALFAIQCKEIMCNSFRCNVLYANCNVYATYVFIFAIGYAYCIHNRIYKLFTQFDIDAIYTIGYSVYTGLDIQCI